MADKMEDHVVPVAVGKIDCPILPEGLVYDDMFEVWGGCVMGVVGVL